VSAADAPVCVLIVDDHIAIAESLQALLSRQQDIEVCGLAADAEEALRLVRERHPDVVLMDQGLPGMSGVEATAKVLAISPETAVLMFSGGMSDDELVSAVEAGMRGYLAKTLPIAEVIAAIRRAAAGEILLTPDELARLLRRGRERARERTQRERQVESLTPREREVLALMAGALDIAAIAVRLGITTNTTRGYVQNILEKFGAHSRLEAVVRANALGLLEP